LIVRPEAELRGKTAASIVRDVIETVPLELSKPPD
jgi:hypothetical protein